MWSDEFDVAGLPDSTKWVYDTERNAAGWYNNELQYYASARAQNSRVENGVLVITARKEDLSAIGVNDWSGQRYSSARLLTRDKASWRYGFIEVRAKLPCGRGSWPAIWMLSTPPQSAWPDDGEIDIMEHVGFDPGVVHASIQTGRYNHVDRTQRTMQTVVPDVSTGFHVYRTEWTADRIETSVDGRVFFSFAREPEGGRGTWPFDRPQHLLLNVAVGGDWGGLQGVDDGSLPYRLLVDHVRVYQRAP